jgi:hypothetical protein
MGLIRLYVTPDGWIRTNEHNITLHSNEFNIIINYTVPIVMISVPTFSFLAFQDFCFPVDVIVKLFRYSIDVHSV